MSSWFIASTCHLGADVGTEAVIVFHPSSQTPGFSPHTLALSPGLKAPVLKAQVLTKGVWRVWLCIFKN